MATMRELLREAKYILWVDNFTEGWQPVPFANMTAIRDYIEEGSVHGPFVITKRMELRALELT